MCIGADNDSPHTEKDVCLFMYQIYAISFHQQIELVDANYQKVVANSIWFLSENIVLIIKHLETICFQIN